MLELEISLELARSTLVVVHKLLYGRMLKRKFNGMLGLKMSTEVVGLNGSKLGIYVFCRQGRK